jgi:hypothetical protein
VKWVLFCAVWVGACTGGGERGGDSRTDAGPDRFDAATARCGAATTQISIWARLPGVTATVAGVSTVLDAEGGELVIDPGICGTTTTLRLEAAGEVVELPADWSLDYEASGLPSDTLLERLTKSLSMGACVAG